MTGRVVDESGEPMVNVAVRAARMGFVAGRRQMAVMTKIRTDDRGIYRFSSLLPGDYVLAVVATVTTESTSYAGAMRANGEPPNSFLQTMTAVGSAPLISYAPVTGVTGNSSRVASSELATASAPPPTGAWLTYPDNLPAECDDPFVGRSGPCPPRTSSDAAGPDGTLNGDLSGSPDKWRPRRVPPVTMPCT